MAPQFTATKGAGRAGDSSCTARATSSLPVPDSPCTSTGAMLRATLPTIACTCCMLSVRPTSRCSAGGGAAARRLGGTRGAVGVGAAAAGRAGARRAATERRGHHGTKLPQVHRLGQVVVGAALERLHRALRRAVGGDDDGLLAARALLQPLQQFQAGAVGQPHVGDDRAVGTLAQQRPGLLDAARGLDHVAFAHQRQLVQRAQIGFVVDDQQAVGGGRGHALRRWLGLWLRRTARSRAA